MRTLGRSWRTLLCIAGLVSSLGTAAADASDTSADDPALINRGEYLAKAADCGACHTAPHNKPFAGGLAIGSPVGVIYSTNITPSMTYGIGRYTLDTFSRALRSGIRADGASLYPAMPYTSYSKLTDEDVSALYAYFMKSVVAVDWHGPRTDLKFPLNIRWSMKVWNLLFLNTAPFAASASHDAEWNRGRYLVEALAHCGECHTPRGFLMQVKSGRTLAGAQLGAWYAPNITSDVTSGVGSWRAEELARYLKTGVLVGKARAAGGMAEAVEDSFQYLSDADLSAMATYVLSVPPIHDPLDDTSRFSLGKAASDLGTWRGTGGIRSAMGTPGGAELFQANCGSCHAALGQGTQDGYYPSLFNNSTVGARNPNNLIATLLNGVRRTTASGPVYMPGFGGGPNGLAALSDEEIARVSNYLIDTFGRGQGHVAAKNVAEVRRGGPASPLPALARAGVTFGACAAIIVFVLLWRSVMMRDHTPTTASRVPK